MEREAIAEDLGHRVHTPKPCLTRPVIGLVNCEFVARSYLGKPISNHFSRRHVFHVDNAF